MSNREAGKGDAPRKQQDQKAYEEGWERIFKKRDGIEDKGKSIKEDTTDEDAD